MPLYDQLKYAYFIAFFFTLIFQLHLCNFCVMLTEFNKQFDSEALQNVTEMIRQKGYSVEEHFVQTKDGYILLLVRIRSINSTGEPKVVFMQHGLLDSSYTWVINNKNQSLGYILAEHGYDVWLSNSRGTTFSRKHIQYQPDEAKFWRFSWDQMAHYDLPASLTYVLNFTHAQKLNYIGHSQGVQIALACFSTYPDLQDKIKLFIALGPVAWLTDVSGLIKFLASYRFIWSPLLEWLTHGVFLPSNNILRFLGQHLCGPGRFPYFCLSIIQAITGPDIPNTNLSRLPVYLAHTPAGTSVQNLVYHTQNIYSGKFQRFDYGPEENLIIYGQAAPPLYNLTNIHIPVAIYHGGNDILSTPRAVDMLVKSLQHSVLSVNFIQSYNHLDYMWAVNAEYEIYENVLRQLAMF